MTVLCEAGLYGPPADPWIVNFLNVPRGSQRLRGGYRRCRRRATHRVSSGCVHEHVITWEACGPCAARTEENLAGKKAARCVECLRLHGECSVIVAVRPLETAVTA